MALKFRGVDFIEFDTLLSDDERLRVWIYIHRQRKEWDAREKEMVAYRLAASAEMHPRKRFCHGRERAAVLGPAKAPWPSSR